MNTIQPSYHLEPPTEGAKGNMEPHIILFSYSALLLALFSTFYVYSWIQNYDSKYKDQTEINTAFQNRTHETLNRFFLELEQARQEVTSLQDEFHDLETQPNRYQAWKGVSQSEEGTLELFIIRQKLSSYGANREWLEMSDEEAQNSGLQDVRDFYLSQINDWETDPWLGGTATLKENMINGWGSMIRVKGMMLMGKAPQENKMFLPASFAKLFEKILQENLVQWKRILTDSELHPVAEEPPQQPA